MFFFIFLLFYSTVDRIEGGMSRSSQEFKAAFLVANITQDLIGDAHQEYKKIDKVKQNNMNKAFEIGYAICWINEKYRQMIDRFNVSVTFQEQLFVIEMLMYLEEIEHLHHELQHLINMVHETERKHGEFRSKEIEFESDAEPGDDDDPFNSKPSRKPRPTPKFKNKKRKHTTATLPPKPPRPPNKDELKVLHKYISLLHPTKKHSTRKWWPLEYGWEIDYFW